MRTCHYCKCFLLYGRWFERTENAYFGKPNKSGTTLLPLIVFIDDTGLTARGNQNAKPIVVTIGTFREGLRQSAVQVFLNVRYNTQ